MLPAGGVALSWLLMMTLGLPLLDYARSNRTLAERLAQHVPAGACVAAPSAPASLVAALEFHGRHAVDARESAAEGACPALVMVLVERGPGQMRSARLAASLRELGWREVARERGPTERREVVIVFRRRPSTALAALNGCPPAA